MEFVSQIILKRWQIMLPRLMKRVFEKKKKRKKECNLCRKGGFHSEQVDVLNPTRD